MMQHLVFPFIVIIQCVFGQSFYDLSAKTGNGDIISFDQFKGSVVLIVNVACLCGYTDDNYKQLSFLYDHYKKNDAPFEILAFPCNQFGKQEPWPESEIMNWTKENYDVKFPIMQKVDVNGDNEDPVFTFLKSKKPGNIDWNFDGKYLIDKNGNVKRRFTNNDPFKKIGKAIRKLLKQQKKEDL
mmetsp:Transcript_31004/g.38070  ORF Transcript_31004/g.38070 Transcript_31004/m.38070 type:complete len:184 (+) Transcript_31004:61-612(+)